MPTLARLYHEGVTRGLLMMPGNNIGYFGEYEHLWRGIDDDRGHWTGCTAGQSVMGLEADGTVKGCPSLPTVGYAGGNVRDLPLETIWRESEAIHFGRSRTDDLWGFCASCYYGDVCRGDAPGPLTRFSGDPGTTPTVTTAPADSKSKVCASESSRPERPRVPPSPSGRLNWSSNRSPLPGRLRRLCQLRRGSPTRAPGSRGGPVRTTRAGFRRSSNLAAPASVLSGRARRLAPTAAPISRRARPSTPGISNAVTP